MNPEHLYSLSVEEIEKVFDEAEKEAEKYEVTVDYYIMEFL